MPKDLAELAPKFLRALGEASLVAYAIAKIVDPFIKSRLTLELGGDLFWALFSSDSPPDFRSAVKQLASLKRYHRSSSWTLNFEWENRERGILKVDISVEVNGVNLDEKDFTPEPAFWLLPSAYPYTSRNTGWRLRIPETDIKQELNADKIEELLNGETTWEQATGSIKVPKNEGFLLEKSATIYPSGCTIPLVHALTSLRQEYHFCGHAVSDLKIQVRHTGAQPEQKILPTQTSFSQIDKTFNEITFPGQVTIICWELRPDRLALGNGKVPEAATSNVSRSMLSWARWLK